MSVSGISSGSNYVSQAQPQPQTQAEKVSEKEGDRDRDDAAKAVAAQQAAAKPTVNTQGQTVGSVISVVA
ncbi:MAG: hypothetical protein PHP57_08560 [Sideroxydans sp.]|nr:hypothetical protein [Sideroxydans sp.]